MSATVQSTQPRDAAPIVIIGGGILGAALAYALSRESGRDVTLLEANTFASGVTAASGAMTRVYHPEASLSDLARAGYQAYDAFRRESGNDCGFVRTGMLYIDSTAKKASLEAECLRLATHDYPMAVLSVDAARQHFPQLTWSDEDIAVHEPEAGYADPVKTTLALLQAAQQNGVRALEHTGVEEILATEGRVTGVRAGGRVWPAATVVLASGTWSQGLLASLGVEIGLYNKAIQTVRLEGTEPSDHPCFFDATTDTFGRPDRGASRVGVVLSERYRDPGPLPLDERAADRARDLVTQRFHTFSERHLAGGIHTVDSYVTDRIGMSAFSGQVQGLYCCLGWGGTGFKVALALALAAAEEILS